MERHATMLGMVTQAIVTGEWLFSIVMTSKLARYPLVRQRRTTELKSFEHLLFIKYRVI